MLRPSTWWQGSAVPVLVSSMSMFILLMHCINYAVNSNSRQKQNNSPNHQPIWACRDWPFMVTRRPGRTSPRVAVSFVITTGCPISKVPLCFACFLGFPCSYRGSFYHFSTAQEMRIPKLTLLSSLCQKLIKSQSKT